VRPEMMRREVVSSVERPLLLTSTLLLFGFVAILFDTLLNE
jgi:hypothetical protein